MSQRAALLFLLIFFCGNLLYAQAPTIEWQRCIGGTAGEQARSITTTSDGGYLVTGFSNSNNRDVVDYHAGSDLTATDYWVAKLNDTSRIEWAISLGGFKSDSGQVVLPVPAGGYLIGGSAASADGNVTSGNHGGYDYWLIKLSLTGGIEWQNSFGGAGEELLTSMKATADGGFILAGTTTSYGGDVTRQHGDRDVWIVKINSAGVLLWQKTLGGSGPDNVNDIQVMPDGGYVFAGTSSSTDGDLAGVHHYNNEDFWTVRLNSSGDIIWQKCLGGNGHDIPYALLVATGGNITVAGKTDSRDGDVSVNHQVPGINYDCWIVQLNSEGVLLWQQSYGGVGDDVIYSMDRTADGGYVAGGYTNSPDITCIADGSKKCWVIKINASGAFQWQKVTGGSLDQAIYAVKSTSDEGIIMAGYTNSPDLPNYHWNPVTASDDFYLVKLSKGGPVAAAPGPASVRIDPVPANICLGSSVTLHATAINAIAGAGYRWTRNGIAVGDNLPSYTASDFQNGDQVICTIGVINNCRIITGLNSNPVMMSISPTPAPVIHISSISPGAGGNTGLTATICSGARLQFNAIVSGGQTAPVYRWQVNGQPAGLNEAAYASNIFGDGDVVYCIYSDNDGCTVPGGSVSNPIQVTVIPAVTPSITITASSTKICAGNAIVFASAPVNGGTAPSYQWQVNGNPAGINAPAFTSSSLRGGDIVYCAMNSNERCAEPATVLSNPVSFTDNGLPAAIRIDQNPDVLCSSQPVTFTAITAGAGPGTVYQWLVNGVAAGTNHAVYNDPVPSDGDIITCLVNDPASGCTLPFSATLPITVHPVPAVAAGQPVILTRGQDVVLDLSPVGDIATYLWTPAEGLSDPTVSNPAATPAHTTTYTLHVATAAGCSASGDVKIFVYGSIVIPNAFTPNGDGHNDIFYVVGSPAGSRVKTMSVFNRWGQMIFHVHDVAPDDPSFGWNGTYRGLASPAGSYVYEMDIGFSDGSHQVFRGTVVLIR